MNHKSTIIHIIITTFLALWAFLFWKFSYPYAMAYQEQYQMFLFDWSYLAQRAAVPGGLAAYVAEFLTQFYISSTFGAIVIAALYATIQLLMMRLMKGLPYREVLSLLPVLMLWWLMGDESVMPAYVVSLVMVLGAMTLVPSGWMGRMIYAIVGFPVLHWICGPLALMSLIYACVLVYMESRRWIAGCVVTVIGVMYAMVHVLVVAQYVPYPLSRLYAGVFYYRMVDVYPYMLGGIGVTALALAVAGAAYTMFSTTGTGKRKIEHKSWMASGGFAFAFVAVAAMFVIPTGYDERKYDLMEYDWLVRMQRWDDIVAKSEAKQPDLPMSVCATNLALAMKGELGDRCFQFYQHGAEGLLPEFERNFSTTLLTGDAYFYLGLVNTSQRYAFEAMEAIPNFNKSVRAIRRLAETNLINGEYSVAEKYLTMLSKTMYYRQWAKKRIEMIHNPKLIYSDRVYGYLRRVRLADDFLFSDKELDRICGQLVMHNKDNMVAIQYLLMFPLLNRDLPTFMNYYGYVQSIVKYSPAVCQEAVALAYAQRGQLPPQQVERYRGAATWRYLQGR